jgi:uncharacterized protein
MVLLDVNVLVGAARQENLDHSSCVALLQLLRQQGMPCLIPLTVGASFLRIVTNKKLFPDAWPTHKALEFLNALVAEPNIKWVGLSDQHWSYFSTALLELKATGKLVPDTQLAALAIEADATLISQDADFGRFSPLLVGLRWWRVDEALAQLQALS